MYEYIFKLAFKQFSQRLIHGTKRKLYRSFRELHGWKTRWTHCSIGVAFKVAFNIEHKVTEKKTKTKQKQQKNNNNKNNNGAFQQKHRLFEKQSQKTEIDPYSYSARSTMII